MMEQYIGFDPEREFRRQVVKELFWLVMALGAAVTFVVGIPLFVIFFFTNLI